MIRSNGHHCTLEYSVLEKLKALRQLWSPTEVLEPVVVKEIISPSPKENHVKPKQVSMFFE